MRFLLVDRITRWDPGRSGAAIKNVTGNDEVLRDHFPGNPVMPGTLILEGMAQLAGMLLSDGLRRQSGRRVQPFLGMVERAKFRAPAVPGDTLVYTADVLSVNDAAARVAVKATCEGNPMAEATIVLCFIEQTGPEVETLWSQLVARWWSEQDAAKKA